MLQKKEEKITKSSWNKGTFSNAKIILSSMSLMYKSSLLEALAWDI